MVLFPYIPPSPPLVFPTCFLIEEKFLSCCAFQPINLSIFIRSLPNPCSLHLLTSRMLTHCPHGFYVCLFICFVFFFFFFGHAPAQHMGCIILVPRTGIESITPPVEAWSPNHWTTRVPPHMILLIAFALIFLFSPQIPATITHFGNEPFENIYVSSLFISAVLTSLTYLHLNSCFSSSADLRQFCTSHVLMLTLMISKPLY